MQKVKADIDLSELRDTAQAISEYLDKLDEPEEFDEPQEFDPVLDAVDAVDVCLHTELSRDSDTPILLDTKKSHHTSSSKASKDSSRKGKKRALRSKSNSGTNPEIDSDSGKSDFLVFDPRDIKQFSENFDLSTSHDKVTKLLDKLHTEERLQVSQGIADWFAAATSSSVHMNVELNQQEDDCDMDAEQMQQAHIDLGNLFQKRRVDAINHMRIFYDKVGRCKAKWLPEDEEEAEGSDHADYVVSGAVLHQQQQQMGSSQQAPLQHKLKRKPRVALTGGADMAGQLLNLISKQQEEVSYLRTRNELSNKAVGSMRSVFEYVRNQKEKAADDSPGGAEAPEPVSLTFQASELLNEIADTVRIRVLGDIIMTKEGRTFLRNRRTRNPNLLAHVQTAELIDECRLVQREIQRLEGRLAIESSLQRVNSPAQRMEMLREEVARMQKIMLMAGHEQLDGNSGTDDQSAAGRKQPLKGLLPAQVAEKRLPLRSAGSFMDRQQQQHSWVMQVSDEVAQQLQAMTARCEKSQDELQIKRKIVADAIDSAKNRAAAEEADKALGVIKAEEPDGIDWMGRVQQASDELQNLRAEVQRLDEEDRELRASLKHHREMENQAAQNLALATSKRDPEGQGQVQKAALAASKRDPEVQGQVSIKSAISNVGSATTGVATNAAHGETDAARKALRAAAEGASSAASAAAGAKGAPVVAAAPSKKMVKMITESESELELLRNESAEMSQDIEHLEQRLSMLHTQSAELNAELAAAAEAESAAFVDAAAAAAAEVALAATAEAPEAAAAEVAEAAAAEAPAAETAEVASPTAAKAEAEGPMFAWATAAEQAVNSAPPPKVPEGNLVLWIQPPQADSGPMLCVVPLSSITSNGSNLPKHTQRVHTSDLLEDDPITREAAQEQVKQVLTYQTETVMLQKQIEEVEEQIRAARRQRRDSYAMKKNDAHRLACMPEQNRNLRREVAEREMELNQLRRTWWAMRSGSTISNVSKQRSLPAQCQPVIKALLGDVLSTSELVPPLPLESVPERSPSSSTVVGILTPSGFMLTTSSAEAPSRVPTGTFQVPKRPGDRVPRQSLAMPHKHLLMEGRSPLHHDQLHTALSPRHQDLGSLHISQISTAR